MKVVVSCEVIVNGNILKVPRCGHGFVHCVPGPTLLEQCMASRKTGVHLGRVNGVHLFLTIATGGARGKNSLVFYANWNIPSGISFKASPKAWLNFGVKSIHSEWVHLLLLFISAEPNNFLVHSRRLNSPSWRLLKNAMGAESDSPRRCPNVCNHKGCIGKVSHFLDEFLGGNGFIWFICVCLIKKSIPLFIFTLYPRKGLKNFWWSKESSLGFVCSSSLIAWILGASWG